MVIKIPSTDTAISRPRTKAIIYVRVSGKKQTTEGDGLESQRLRCMEYASTRGYEVIAVFSDEVSGGGDFMKRPGMVKLLAMLDALYGQDVVVVFDDLKRYSRDTLFHIILKREMEKRGARRECLNFKFEDTPEGEFIETMIAAQGQLEREQNRRQVIQKQTAKLKQGYWCSQAPAGYRYAKASGGGKIMVRDEPLASFVADILNRFAVGALQTQAEVKRELEACPYFPRSKSGKIYSYRVTRLLTQVLYAGYLEMPSWKIARRKAQHEPLIDLETFGRIQHRLKEGSYAPTRKDIRDDFILRGHVQCADCGYPLTSCYSKSKTGKRHPYYRCHHSGCKSYGKSIRQDKMENEFEDVLKTLKPSPTLFSLVFDMFKDGWEARSSQQKEWHKDLRAEIALKDNQIASFLDRIVATDNSTVIAAYEKKIEQLETEKLIFAEKLANTKNSQGSFRELFELAFEFLSNPCKLWDSGDLMLRRTVLKLAFTGRVAYDREMGFLNPKKAFPFKLLEEIQMKPEKMVRATGLEPVQPRAEGF